MGVIGTCAQLSCVDIYDPVSHTRIYKIYSAGDSVCGTAILNGVFYITLQGTENFAGLLTDLDMDTIYDKKLGHLHHGFAKSADKILGELIPHIPNNLPIVLTGHSKGAAEACLLSAMLKMKGFNVIKNVLFACPNPGYHQLFFWLSKNIPGISFRNTPFDMPILGDPIPLLPTSSYHPPYYHTLISQSPKCFLGMFNPPLWHSAKLYHQACITM